jgi:hypothetical protein
MKPLTARWQTVAVLPVAACVAGWTWAQDAPGPRPAAKDAGPVSVRTFEGRPPVGYLGHPLGTVVRVTGVCIDGDLISQKLYAGKTVLRVEAVNGRKLPGPTDFFFDRAAGGVPKPKPGQRFDYTAHEYGSFDGIVRVPEEPGAARVIGVAGPSFGYQSHLEVHKAHPVK